MIADKNIIGFRKTSTLGVTPNYQWSLFSILTLTEGITLSDFKKFCTLENALDFLLKNTCSYQRLMRNMGSSLDIYISRKTKVVKRNQRLQSNVSISSKLGGRGGLHSETKVSRGNSATTSIPL